MESKDCSQHCACDHFQLYGCKGPVDREPCGSSVHRYTHREQILNYLTGLTDFPNYDYTHRIHVWYNYISIYIYHKNQPNVGKYYTSPMDPMGYTMMQSSQNFAWTNSGYLWESFTEMYLFSNIWRHLRAIWELHTWLTYKPKRPQKKYLWLTGRVHILRQLGFPCNMSFNELDTKFLATKWIDLWIASWWAANV